MSQTEQTRSFIQDFFSALDERAAERIRIAENCCYTGSMLAGTIRGAADVREHIANVAPFIDRIEIGRVVVEGSSGAVLARLQGLGGKTIDGAMFFEVEDGQLTRFDNLFDTRQLVNG
jgi:hypothetical protein